jgi:hypothetical protein
MKNLGTLKTKLKSKKQFQLKKNELSPFFLFGVPKYHFDAF